VCLGHKLFSPQGTDLMSQDAHSYETSGIGFRPLALPDTGPNPLVSILMANYNYARYLGTAIESALQQSYRNLELIVCDDGSTDNSVEIARRFVERDPRVRLIEKANGGQASAFNAAFSESRGQILCLLDSDDAFSPEKLTAVVQLFREQKGTGLIVHPMVVIDSQDRKLQQLPFIGTFEKGWLGPRLVRRGGRWRFMPSSCVAFRRELGAYCFPIPEPGFRTCADAFIFTMLPLVTEVGYLDQPLCQYRIHGSNIVGTRQISSKTVRSNRDSLVSTLDAVNVRLAALGIPVQLAAEKNIYIRMETFKYDLLTGLPFRALLRQYWKLASEIVADDLLHMKHKAGLLIANGMALLCPVGCRAWILTRISAPSRLKYYIQKVMSGLAWILGFTRRDGPGRQISRQTVSEL